MTDKPEKPEFIDGAPRHPVHTYAEAVDVAELVEEFDNHAEHWNTTKWERRLRAALRQLERREKELEQQIRDQCDWALKASAEIMEFKERAEKAEAKCAEYDKALRNIAHAKGRKMSIDMGITQCTVSEYADSERKRIGGEE